MKKSVKIYFLAALVLSICMALASCADTADNGDKSGIESGASMENNPSEGTEETSVEFTLPEIDLGGAEFMFASRGPELSMFESKELYAEEMNGEPINDAVYVRNMAIEEKYNCVIKEKKCSTYPASAVRTSLKAGDGTYDVVLDSAMFLRNLAEENLLTDMSKLEYVNLGNSYWDQGAVEGFTIGNSLYFCVGELNMMAKDCTWVTLYNKKVAEELAMPNFYQMVRDGKWTLDEFYVFAKSATRDLDGDGQLDEFDRWGYAGESYNFFSHMIGCGSRFSVKTGEDYPEAVIYTDKNLTVADKVLTLLTDPDVTLLREDYLGKYARPGPEVLYKSFEEDRVLFLVSGLIAVTYNLRGMESSFGVLPIPKWDENQEKYHATVSMSNISATAIAASGTKVKETGFVVEALQALSQTTLTEAYYNVNLTHKDLRDEESKEMLDLVFKNRVYDTAMAYDWGGWMQISENICRTKNNTFTSDYEKIENKVQAALESMIAMYMAD